MSLLGIFLVKPAADLDEDYNRSGTRKFWAGFDSSDDENYVQDHCGFVPNLPHPTDLGKVVVNIHVEMKGDSPCVVPYQNPEDDSDPLNGTPCYLWDIEITYGAWNPLEHTATGNPVDQPVEVSFDWQIFSQPADVAIDPTTGNFVALVNSAGVPFDPPIERDQLRGVLRVAWNSLTFDPSTFFVYGNQINADVWNGFPIGSVKFSPPKMPQRLYSQFLGQNYWRLEAEFVFNPNAQGWNVYPIDRGFMELDGSGVLQKIIDSRGQPYPEPSLLDGSGHLEPDPTNYVQLEFQIYTSINFSTTFSNLNNLFS